MECVFVVLYFLERVGRGGLESGHGPNMSRFRLSCVHLVYFLRKSTEFHVNSKRVSNNYLSFLTYYFLIIPAIADIPSP